MGKIKNFWQTQWQNFKDTSLEIKMSVLAGAVLLSAFIPCLNKIWIYGDDWSGEATRSIVLTLGAIGGAYGLFLASRRLDKFSKHVEIEQKQAETAEANLFNDRLSRAVVGLSNNESLGARNAALRLLKNLAEDLPEGARNHDLVCEIIHGFICNRAMMPPRDKNNELPSLTETPEQRADIGTAIIILFALVPVKKRGGRYSLDKLDLRQLDLSWAELKGANLSGVNLQGANLSEAGLQGADLFHAELQSAVLPGAKLQGADLSEAKLQGADLFHAELQGADLSGAELQGADLSGARLEGAGLFYTHLERAFLRDAHLKGATLTGAYLEGADLSYCDLEAVKNLTQGQINQIVFELDGPLLNLPNS